MCVSLGKFDDIPLNQGGSSYSHSRGRGPHSPTGLFAGGAVATYVESAAPHNNVEQACICTTMTSKQ